MSEMDLDAKTKDKDVQVRLPWESIDPLSDQEFSRSASTATKPVEAGTTRAKRFNSYKDKSTAEEREERYVTHAFFSDEENEAAVTTAGAIVSEEVVAVTPVITEVAGPAVDEARTGTPTIENQNFLPDAVPASAEADPVNAVAHDSGSLAPVLGEEDWNEGPSIESHEAPGEVVSEATNEMDFGRVGVLAHHPSSPQDEMVGEYAHPTNRGDWLSVENYESERDAVAASAEADPTSDPESSAESRNLMARPSPQTTAVRNEERELVADVPAVEQTEMDVTPWATMDETPAETVPLQPEAIAPLAEPAPVPQPAAVEPEPVEIPENFVALSTHAATEATVTFSSSDSIVAAASELATMSEAFGAKPPVEAPAAAAPEMDGVFIVPMPQASVAETEPVVESTVQTEADIEAPSVTTGGGWTIPVMCVGIGLIACCMVIPQGEFNRKLNYEQLALKANLQHVQKQVAVNDAFLKNVMDDPTLAQRLAGRQMKTIRKGQKVVPLQQDSDENDMSPFALVAVDPPPALPAYHAARGTIADLCNNARVRLYLLGISMAMVAVGLVMGFNPKPDEQA